MEAAVAAEEAAVPLPRPFPRRIPWPPVATASGLYVWDRRTVFPKPIPFTLGPEAPGAEAPVEEVDGPQPQTDSELLFPFLREELRLDVDGRYPQFVASGTVKLFLRSRIHWIADLKPTSANSWFGRIWYRDGDVGRFPYTNVQIWVSWGWLPHLRRRTDAFTQAIGATVRFSGGGAPDRVRRFRYRSPYFHPVEFEFDCAEGAEAVTTIQTHAHPNHPDSLPDEELSVETVYRRAGFNVRTSPDKTVVPLADAGGNARWSDMEMHDAMQTYWSRFTDRAQWAMWVFFASLHEMGTSLGGIMFDDIGPNHRQGTAIFNDSFISNAPAGDPNPGAWVQRMRFWTACHEMGHAFNLAHSWQKALGTPWIPLANEPEARSFMNYPYRVSGGQSEFFEDFEYRFSDGELLFVRHAPARFVQMGNADWFDDHGFEQLNVSPEPAFKIELRANRPKPLFEFMEPVVLEVKLTNSSSQPTLIDENVLSAGGRLTVVIKKRGQPAREFIPYAQYCLEPMATALAPGESIYESLFVSSGLNGFDIAEPGYYTVQVALHLGNEDVVSNALHVRIAPPVGYDEEFLAQDFFSDSVGRILTFDGSRFLTGGNDTLREVVEQMGDRRVALHARVALGNAMSRRYRELTLGDGVAEAMPAYMAHGEIKVSEPQVEGARQELATALTVETDLAAESLGHIDYKYYVDCYSDWLADQGERTEAKKTQDELHRTLAARGVLDKVLDDVVKRRDSY